SAKAQPARTGTRTELRREPVAAPKPPAEAPKAAPPKDPPRSSEQAAQASSSELTQEAKPAPVKPYIRNPRPTVFDRVPAPPPTKANPEPVDAPTAKSEAAAADAAAPPASSEAKVARAEEEQNTGENLEFDFNDESAPEIDDDSGGDDLSAEPGRWSVGDEDGTPPSDAHPTFGRGEPDPGFSRGEPAPIGRGTIPQYARMRTPDRSTLPDERAFMERTELHSARTFIGLFFGVAIVFVLLTLVICGIPSAGAELLRRMPVLGPEFEQPAPLENRVIISDVKSDYQRIKDGRRALVLTGTVTNNSDVALHTVRIGVRLLDSDQHDLASAAVFCGSTISARMIGEMTPRELDFLQKLDPPKNFMLQPRRTAPFQTVFIDPPREVRHFAIAVARAQPLEAAQIGEASARP
ncbi:MAG TPA: DUF3426 domain-containing protein, partial [Candidatus Binataceae bacterium]|nr:DUF3426 domain-containing protein [Candidatus Binataceae bacterium]